MRFRLRLLRNSLFIRVLPRACELKKLQIEPQGNINKIFQIILWLRGIEIAELS
jgi:hypothetical protein